MSKSEQKRRAPKSRAVRRRKLPDYAVEFGHQLKDIRLEIGMSQEELAELADISTDYVKRLEAGLYVPTIEVVDGIRCALRVTWAYLMAPIGRDVVKSAKVRKKPMRKRAPRRSRSGTVRK